MVNSGKWCANKWWESDVDMGRRWCDSVAGLPSLAVRSHCHSHPHPQFVTNSSPIAPIDVHGSGRVVSFALGLIAMSILGISFGWHRPRKGRVAM